MRITVNGRWRAAFRRVNRDLDLKYGLSALYPVAAFQMGRIDPQSIYERAIC